MYRDELIVVVRILLRKKKKKLRSLSVLELQKVSAHDWTFVTTIYPNPGTASYEATWL